MVPSHLGEVFFSLSSFLRVKPRSLTSCATFMIKAGTEIPGGGYGGGEWVRGRGALVGVEGGGWGGEGQ